MHPIYYHRRSIRVPGFDYTRSGLYFITIVTAGRVLRFGGIANCEVQLNPIGQMAQREWLRLPSRFPGLLIEDFVMMPNHLHGILMLGEQEGDRDQESSQVEPGSIGAIIRAYKSSTTLRFHQLCPRDSTPLWQRNYYERIVRGLKDFDRIREYIQNNPSQWELDQEHFSPPSTS